MPSQFNPNNLVLESHEDRLQRLETGINDVSTQLVEQKTKLEGLSQQVSDGEVRISEKLDSTAKHITDKLDNVTISMNESTKIQNDHTRKLEVLESKEDHRSKTKATYRKIAIGLLVMSSGAFVTKMVEVIWTAFIK